MVGNGWEWYAGEACRLRGEMRVAPGSGRNQEPRPIDLWLSLGLDAGHGVYRGDEHVIGHGSLAASHEQLRSEDAFRHGLYAS